MESSLPEYVFRGTTLGFKGNASSNRIPVTSTTSNPAKALIFALNANYAYKKQGIIYIAETSLIKSVAREEANWFESYEEEIGYSIKPGDFQELCLGYVTVETMKEGLIKGGIVIDLIANPHNISLRLAEIGILSAAQIEQVVKIIRAQVKKD